KASRMDAALAREPAEPVDMDKFLEDIAGFYTQTRRETGVDVIHMASGASEPIIVRVLENSLGQVLRNLIDNALTFSPQPVSDDGPISSVRVQAHRVNDADKDYVLVTIDDDGPGISAENLEDVFNRFYTYRPENASFGDHSGLGLAICRQIMDAHNGTITASNRMDDGGKISGARFTLRFPVRRVSEDGKKKKRKNPRNPKKTKTSRQKNRP
ncbi:MAG TPA: HAMP domain-containing histidine kinase, partial [Hellea balneolensis]|nr:HAMP domain-containing histidine kinase [Hellea balneolensis]